MKVSDQIRHVRQGAEYSEFQKHADSLAVDAKLLQDWAKKLPSLTPQKRTQVIKKIKGALPGTKRLLDKIEKSI
jgi:hypothetical protein